MELPHPGPCCFVPASLLQSSWVITAPCSLLSYLHTVLCVPNPSTALLVSLLSKDIVSVHGLTAAPLKVGLGELMDPPSVSALQSKETWPRHKLQA